MTAGNVLAHRAFQEPLYEGQLKVWHPPTVPIASYIQGKENWASRKLIHKKINSLASSVDVSTIDEKDSKGLTKLMRAVIYSREKAVRQLISLGAGLEVQADINLDDGTEFKGLTALGIAALIGNNDMVKLLVSLGADPQGGSYEPTSVSFSAGEQNDETTSLLHDIVKARGGVSVLEQLS